MSPQPAPCSPQLFFWYSQRRYNPYACSVSPDRKGDHIMPDSILEKRAPTSVPIHDLFVRRWSSRAFDPNRPVSREQLTTLLEAGRWAMSCNGDEPWRYLIWDKARDPQGWQKAFDCLSEEQPEVGQERAAPHAFVRGHHVRGDGQAQPPHPARYRRGELLDLAAGDGERAHGAPDGRLRHGKGARGVRHPGRVHAHGHDRGRLPDRARHPRRRDEGEGAAAARAQAARGAVLRGRMGAGQG